MNLRNITILIPLLLLSLTSMAQESLRTQFTTYPLRKDAEVGDVSASANYIAFAPQFIEAEEGVRLAQQSFEVPQSWVDASAYLHIEGVGTGYTLWINGREVADCNDSYSPIEYEISRFLRVGENVVSILLHPSAFAVLEQGIEPIKREIFEGSYIYTQSRLKVLDYSLELTKYEEGGHQHGQLFIDVVVENRFNFDETIDVGFDIYDPSGKLLDFSSSEVTLAGGATDTIRFAPYLYGAEKFLWEPSKSKMVWSGGRQVKKYEDQPLYTAMLFTRRNRVSSDYIPFKVGFFVPQYADGKLSIDDREIFISSYPYSTTGDKAQSEKELRAIKSEGYNTIIPSVPQPIWFYSLCDKIGLYVIDQVAINAIEASKDKSVGGSPSNDPALLGEYLERVKRAYYRTRNFSCVVAYSLGGDSGNGYNMYKAYQWLKSVEERRPVIYTGAAGEWNSDPLTIR